MTVTDNKNIEKYKKLFYLGVEEKILGASRSVEVWCSNDISTASILNKHRIFNNPSYSIVEK